MAKREKFSLVGIGIIINLICTVEKIMSDMENSRNDDHAPEISPYVFTALLTAFGLWCFYDGWLTVDPSMQEHYLINRIVSAVLLPWAGIDFWRVWNYKRKNE